MNERTGEYQSNESPKQEIFYATMEVGEKGERELLMMGPEDLTTLRICVQTVKFLSQEFKKSILLEKLGEGHLAERVVNSALDSVVSTVMAMAKVSKESEEMDLEGAVQELWDWLVQAEYTTPTATKTRTEIETLIEGPYQDFMRILGGRDEEGE
jgi:hypothetical protein